MLSYYVSYIELCFPNILEAATVPLTEVPTTNPTTNTPPTIATTIKERPTSSEPTSGINHHIL